jgi:serine protease Do
MVADPGQTRGPHITAEPAETSGSEERVEEKERLAQPQVDEDTKKGVGQDSEGRSRAGELGEENAAVGTPPDAPPNAAEPPVATVNQLTALSAAFREVARRVKPSVVQVAAEIRPEAKQHRLSSRVSPGDMQQLLRRFGPLVELDPELQQFFRGRRFEQPEPDYQQYNIPLPVGSASGWIYDDQGHVVTNHHVVARADHIKLMFADDTEAEAELVGSDPQTDVAVLHTEKPRLAPVTLASQEVKQGDLVLAVGSPFRYAFSLSQGIVSATGRQMGILGPHGYENFIQTDAAINPGNSGGPLINTRGEVVGMNTAIASRSGAFAGIGFAIPAGIIRDVVDELVRKGRIERGYLGVMISDDEPLLATFGVDQGVLIEDVADGGPADRAGLEPGDVIVQIDGQPADGASALRQEIARTDPGQTMRFGVVREGQRRQLQVTLEQQPADDQRGDRSTEPPQPALSDSAEADALGKLGFNRLEAVTPEFARRYGLEQSWGVLVLDVRPFSAAAVAGLGRGHIITHVQGQKVTDVEELRKEVAGRDLGNGVRMRVSVPGGPARFVLLSLEP